MLYTIYYYKTKAYYDVVYRSMGLVPDEGEDMWHTYNIIAEGDRLRATTIRKVQQESATGSSTSSRVRTTITIQVEAVTFDTAACMLRLVLKILVL